MSLIQGPSPITHETGVSTESFLFNASDFGDADSITAPFSVIANNQDRMTAQRLHAWRYLMEGYIDDHSITSEGVINEVVDPYKNDSEYFVLADSTQFKPESGQMRPLVTARQIGFNPEKGMSSFPLLSNMDISEEVQHQLRSTDLKNCVEISGLAKVEGVPRMFTLMVYREMWQYSLRSGHDTWFIASDSRLTENLKDLFNGALTSIGPRKYYMGSETDPMILYPKSALTHIMKDCLTAEQQATPEGQRKKAIVELVVDGLDPTLLTEEEQMMLYQVMTIDQQ